MTLCVCDEAIDLCVRIYASTSVGVVHAICVHIYASMSVCVVHAISAHEAQKPYNLFRLGLSFHYSSGRIQW